MSGLALPPYYDDIRDEKRRAPGEGNVESRMDLSKALSVVQGAFDPCIGVIRGQGEKERTQVFEGVVIRRRRGGASATFTVRKVSYGIGVERIFPVESPAVQKVEIKSRGHVRRSRLYYLRDLRGKKARLRTKLRDLSALISEEEAEGPLETAAPVEAEAAEPEAAESAEATETKEDG